ncbi:MAG: (2Fe-2S) ferredoxin domain-containing protein [Clostridiales bacterium]|nr:(2Fe-2S) ferredoxin domain-containing protein [Clostridiales bacterium]
MKTLKELEKIRYDEAAEKSGKIKVLVGMATCGIAAGARPVMNSFANEIRTRGIKNVELAMMGCIGMCSLEPIVEVYDVGGTKTTYIKMDEVKAARVVKEHILGGNVCKEYTAE